ncbi:hypothetical protein [Mangrovicella endophytica]|uniref:hypothetical protein n=1 Tax=Mangrovicella endophytica TaxID=2066697 RepID=UPI000C9E20B2|nr:hypothetical protein [Mangrovicella endophytica]
MRSHLEVAVCIADSVLAAMNSGEPLDVAATATALSHRNLVPDISILMIADALREEGRSAGIRLH